jgi:hypothetical protein
VVFQVGLQPAWVKLAVCAREAFSTAAEVSHSAITFCSQIIVGLYYKIQEMGIFPMSVANNFCDMPFPKYHDLKTVLIYRLHPVFEKAKKEIFFFNERQKMKVFDNRAFYCSKTTFHTYLLS